MTNTNEPRELTLEELADMDAREYYKERERDDWEPGDPYWRAPGMTERDFI